MNMEDKQAYLDFKIEESWRKHRHNIIAEVSNEIALTTKVIHGQNGE